jgi:molybdopterin-guanine dinucleotide biosynthesis protein A
MIHQDITGVVLAGGNSGRMGQDKALMQVNGKSLIRYAVDILHQVCGKVIISANKPDYLDTGCEIWPDELGKQAPMVGIYSCLKRSQNEWIAVLSCDMPLVNPLVFDLLMSNTDASKYDVVVPVHDKDCIEPLCGLYNRRVLQLLDKSIDINQFSMQQFIMHAKHKLVRTGSFQNFYNANLFANINTPNDFDLLK